MGLIDKMFPRASRMAKLESKIESQSKILKSVEAYYGAASYGQYSYVISLPYDGEKNLGEMGPPRQYYMDYPRLRARSWQSFIESDITQTVIKKFVMWVVGTGLRLQCEPESEILREEGISLDSEAFNESVERRWKLWSNSKGASVSDMMTLNSIAKEAKKNAIIGGDVLVRLKFTDEGLKVQLIDGSHITQPIQANLDGRIRHGVEVDENGKHVAFYVRKPNSIEHEKVLARTKDGQEVAFLVYGMRYRIDDTRGVPLVSVVLETLSKLDRYKEATVGSAEERAKIPYFIEHDLGSTGENPLTDNMARAFSGVGYDNADGKLPITDDGKRLADKVAATTNKQTFNMPPGSRIVSLDTKNDLYFKEFYDTNINIICAALCIPPDVARSMYNSNFSASRAALKDWEHSLKVERGDLTEQFYGKVYDSWLFYQVFNDKINAPGYVSAYLRKDKIILDAYSCARFVGDQVPHIDPYKEAMAERLKLGETGKNIPLTTVEDACERLDTGDSDSIVKQYSEEMKQSIDLGIPMSNEPIAVPANPDGLNPNE